MAALGCGRQSASAPVHFIDGNAHMSTKVMILSTIVALVSVSALRAQQPADGPTLYAKTCASCHGPKGTPAPAMARSMAGIPDFANAQAMASVADSVMRHVVSEGKGRTMPSYKARLTPEQINALVRYIRTLSRH
jgi:mono/diheme cytochrome c family protein